MIFGTTLCMAVNGFVYLGIQCTLTQAHSYSKMILFLTKTYHILVPPNICHNFSLNFPQIKPLKIIFDLHKEPFVKLSYFSNSSNTIGCPCHWLLFVQQVKFLLTRTCLNKGIRTREENRGYNHNTQAC